MAPAPISAFRDCPGHLSNLIAILHASREYGQERARSRPRESVALHSQDVTPSPDRERAAGFPPPPVGTTRLSRDYLSPEVAGRATPDLASRGTGHAAEHVEARNRDRTIRHEGEGPEGRDRRSKLLELIRASSTQSKVPSAGSAHEQAIARIRHAHRGEVLNHGGGARRRYGIRGGALNLRVGPVGSVDSRGVHQIQVGDGFDGQAVAATRHVAEQRLFVVVDANSQRRTRTRDLKRSG